MHRQHGIAAVAFALGAVVSSSALAHARLESSDPQASSTVPGTPRQLRLRFNEALEPAFSRIRLVDARNAEVALPRAEVDKADPKQISVPLPALPGGSYRVQWTATSHDSHKIKGEFTFQVR